MTDKKTKARTCPACGSGNIELAFIRGGVHYYRCNDCGTIFSKPLKQADMVGGGAEVERAMQNAERVQRFKNLMGKPFTALDYGCGNGYLVKAMKEAGIPATGYDPYLTNDPHSIWPDVYFDLYIMVEVIEHLQGKDFKNAMERINGCANSGAILYIETCFCDVCGPDSPYIDPKVGHSTIWSYAGLDAAMSQHGWELHSRINSTVVTYVKR
jgi:ribosomal protein L37AE/L43A